MKIRASQLCEAIWSGGHFKMPRPQLQGMARSCPAISANFVSIVARTAGDSSGCGSTVYCCRAVVYYFLVATLQAVVCATAAISHLGGGCRCKNEPFITPIRVALLWPAFAESHPCPAVKQSRAVSGMHHSLLMTQI